MSGALILLVVWLVVLAYIAAVKPETMQMTWLLSLALMGLLGLLWPIAAIFWPALR